MDGSGFVLLSKNATLTLGADDTNATFYGKIRNDYPDAGAAVSKVGKGVWTLYGAQEYSGATRILGGTLDLRGGITGNVQVETGGTLAGTGHIGGALTIHNGSLAVNLAGAKPKMLTVTGAATLAGTLTLTSMPTTGRQWTVLRANVGISGTFSHLPGGFTVRLAEGGKALLLVKR